MFKTANAAEEKSKVRYSNTVYFTLREVHYNFVAGNAATFCVIKMVKFCMCVCVCGLKFKAGRKFSVQAFLDDFVSGGCHLFLNMLKFRRISM